MLRNNKFNRFTFKANAFQAFVHAFLVGSLLLGGTLGTVPRAFANTTDVYPQVKSVNLDASGAILSIKTTKSLQMDPIAPSKPFSVLKLANPLRLVIDLPDTILATPYASVQGPDEGIQKIELSEAITKHYRASRITVYVANHKILNQLQVVPQADGLVVSANEPLEFSPKERTFSSKDASLALVSPLGLPNAEDSLPPSPPTPTKVKAFESSFNETAGLNVIQDVFFRDDQLVVKGANGAQILLKNKLVLNDPGRLVVDLDKAVVGDKELLKPISVNQENIRQVRVGQFDDQTVRIVIESKFPERLQLNYVGPDKALLAITASGVMATNTLPSDATLGTLKNILVSKERGDPVIRVNTTTPMVHRLIKDNGKLFLELANISGNPGWVGFDRAQFPQIDYMKVEPLTLGQPNSKLVVELKNGSDLDVASNMSVDGKTLEITLYPNPNAGYRSRAPWGDSIKAPFAARVVIDAGHGGKDLGANREGLNEKDLNLSVALKLKRALESRGVKVYMTRSTDQFLPLPQITQITNDIHPDLFVSVHTNSSTNPGITGLETYYYSPQSIALARRVHNRVVNNIASPDRGVRYARFYVIHHTPVPAILCEMGYISNASERADLFSEARKEKTANAIADGVVDYLRAALSANAKR